MDLFTLIYKVSIAFLIVVLSIGMTIIAHYRMKELKKMEEEKTHE